MQDETVFLCRAMHSPTRFGVNSVTHLFGIRPTKGVCSNITGLC